MTDAETDEGAAWLDDWWSTDDATAPVLHPNSKKRQYESRESEEEPDTKRARIENSRDMLVHTEVPALQLSELAPTETSIQPCSLPLHHSEKRIAPWSNKQGLLAAQAALAMMVRRKDLGEFFRRRLGTMLAVLNLHLDPELKFSIRVASDMARRAAKRKAAHALQLRRWIFAFIEDGTLPTHQLGLFSTSALRDEDFARKIHLHLMELSAKEGYVSAADIVVFVSSEEMREDLGGKLTISERTARGWLKNMDWRFSKDEKGMYIDGHEREDVVAYRTAFLARWEGYERRMQLHDADGNVTHEPQLQPGEQPLILYTHDESTFYAHDRQKSKWTHKEITPTPQAKGEGESLMISDFLSPEVGRLKTGERCVVDGCHTEKAIITCTRSARLLFRAGKGRDGYLDGAKFESEAAKSIDIFEARHPGCQMLAAFDNATTHLRRPSDGLSARKMTKEPKAEWFPKVNGVRMRNGELPDGTSQPLYWPVDHTTVKLRGHFKGMKQILSERGKWPLGGLLSECSQFKCLEGATSCCARRMMFNEPDFVGQKSALEELYASRGHICDFYPKFHCELNFIEQYWGAAKRQYRVTAPTKGTKAMQQNILACLDSVPQAQIRRCVQH